MPRDSNDQKSSRPLGYESQYADIVVIPHYWGTTARGFMVGAVALMLAAWPLYGTSGTNSHVVLAVAGALVAVGFAALTNPRSRWVSVVDALISGTGTAVFAIWGIAGYDGANSLAFVLRIVVALFFLAAFYFSLKTVRAFMLREVGKPETRSDLEAITREEVGARYDPSAPKDPDYPHHHQHSGHLEL